jgi:hypothetical protein
LITCEEDTIRCGESRSRGCGVMALSHTCSISAQSLSHNLNIAKRNNCQFTLAHKYPAYEIILSVWYFMVLAPKGMPEDRYGTVFA